MTLPACHPVVLPVDELLADCAIRRTRRSGPGGQYRNKVETAIVIEHRPTGIVAQASERRSQAENQKIAIARLRMNLALSVRSAVARRYEPSSLWRSRCHGGRLAISAGHADFAPILSEALDVVAARGWDPRAAAAELGCTPSQLTKLLAIEPRALQKVNDERVRIGLHRLK